MTELRLQWHGHACFTVEAGGYRVVLDPYADGAVPGLGPLRLEGHRVLCSHEHHDHNNTAAVRLLPWPGEAPLRVETMDVFHDDQGGALRGKNRIHVLSCGGIRVAHLGDLGHALSPEQAAALGPLDGVMIPVGGYYTIDAALADQTARILGARTVIPMHFRRGETGFPVLGTLEDFLALRRDGIYADGPWVAVTKDGPKGTVVLKL